MKRILSSGTPHLSTPTIQANAADANNVAQANGPDNTGLPDPVPENPALANLRRAQEAAATLASHVANLDGGETPFDTALELGAALDACEELEEALLAVQCEPGHDAAEIHKLEQELKANRAKVMEHCTSRIGAMHRKVPGLELAASMRTAIAAGDFDLAREHLQALGKVQGLDPQIHAQAVSDLLSAERRFCGPVNSPLSLARHLHFFETLLSIGSSDALDEAAELLDEIAQCNPDDAAAARERAAALASALLRLGKVEPIKPLLATLGISLDDLFERAVGDCHDRLEFLAVAAAAQEARDLELTGFRPQPSEIASAPAAAATLGEWRELLPKIAAMLARQLPDPADALKEWRALLDDLRPQLGRSDYVTLSSMLKPAAEAADQTLAPFADEALKAISPEDDPQQAAEFQKTIGVLITQLQAGFKSFNFEEACATLHKALDHPHCDAASRNQLRQLFVGAMLEFERSVESMRDEEEEDAELVLQAKQNLLIAMVRFGELDEATALTEQLSLAANESAEPGVHEFDDRMRQEFQKRNRPSDPGLPPPVELEEIDACLADLIVPARLGAAEAVTEELESIVAGIVRGAADGSAEEVESAVGAVLDFLESAPHEVFEAAALTVPTGVNRARLWRCLMQIAWLAKQLGDDDARNELLTRFTKRVAAAASNPADIARVENLAAVLIGQAFTATMKASGDADVQSQARAFASLFPDVQPYAFVLRELQRAVAVGQFVNIGIIVKTAAALTPKGQEERVRDAVGSLGAFDSVLL